jgi:hypothetical protein
LIQLAALQAGKMIISLLLKKNAIFFAKNDARNIDPGNVQCFDHDFGDFILLFLIKYWRFSMYIFCSKLVKIAEN